MPRDNTLKAIVRGGRITLDEPTDLPDGEIIELVPVDRYAHLDESTELEPSEKARLDAAIKGAWDSYQSGEATVSAEEVVAKLRAKA